MEEELALQPAGVLGACVAGERGPRESALEFRLPVRWRRRPGSAAGWMFDVQMPLAVEAEDAAVV